MLTKLSSEKLISTIIILTVVAIHLGLVFFPPVNFEFAFVDAARYFNSNNNKILLDQYFTYQANTVGLSYFSSTISRIFPQIDLLILIRLLNLCGILLLGVGVYRICNFLGQRNHVAILTLILLNPLVWTFSGRATADFLPMAVGIFAISLALCESNFLLSALIAGLFLGIAAILKYHTLCLLIFLAALLWGYKLRQASLIKVIIVAIVSISIVGAYLIKAHSLFGFWVTPVHFQSELKLNLSGVVNNFILYTGFLVLLSIPSVLISSEFRSYVIRHWMLLIPCLGIIFLYGLYGLQDAGELNFGPLDHWIGTSLRIAFLSLMSLAALILIFISTFNIAQKNILKLLLGLSLVVVLLALSSSRPTQRYLILVLPFFLLILPSGIIRSRIVFLSTVTIFACANIFIEYSRWCTGTAAKVMVNKIEVAGLLKVTGPGDILPHVGNRFYPDKQTVKTYSVVSGENSQSIITSQAGFYPLQKSFSLIPVESNENIQYTIKGDK